MFINYPNNPTAAVAPLSFYREVVDFAADHHIVVVSDNPYSEVAFDGYRAPSFLETKGAMEVGVEMHSLSKTYNMTGWRIGMAVGNAEILAGLGRVKTNVDSGVFNAVQHAAIAALSGPQDCVKEACAIYQERRDVLVDGLRELGFDVPSPKATFYVWMPVKGLHVLCGKTSQRGRHRGDTGRRLWLCGRRLRAVCHHPAGGADTGSTRTHAEAYPCETPPPSHDKERAPPHRRPRLRRPCRAIRHPALRDQRGPDLRALP